MWASAKFCGVEQRAPPIFGRAAIDHVGHWPTFLVVFKWYIYLHFERCGTTGDNQPLYIQQVTINQSVYNAVDWHKLIVG